jgi:outer membrane biosynthesis protein TonB
MAEEQEKKNKRIGLTVSIGVHLIVLLLFLFMVAWRAPDPPLPEYGIELNFGLDDQGTGDIQPESETTSTAASEESSEDSQQHEVIEESQEEVKSEEAQPTSEGVTAKTESPVVVEEVKEAKKETKPVEKADEKKVEPKPTEKVAEKKETKSLDPAATYTNSENNKQANQGDDTKKAGDKGNPEGTLDAKALYGQQGGGGGAGLDLAGWDWDEIPSPKIPANESDGRIEFEIKVDDNGEITFYRVLERSLSIEAEKACKEAISKLTFSKKPGAIVPAVSVGKITFVVRTR